MAEQDRYRRGRRLSADLKGINDDLVINFRNENDKTMIEKYILMTTNLTKKVGFLL